MSNGCHTCEKEVKSYFEPRAAIKGPEVVIVDIKIFCTQKCSKFYAIKRLWRLFKCNIDALKNKIGE